MSRLFAAITLILSVALTILITVVCSIPIIIAGIIKLLLPVPIIWRSISVFADFMMYCWCEGLAFLLKLNPYLKWDIEGLDELSKKNWYLLICNHRSWADIVILCVLLSKHIPMNKYFLKQQLAWVPFMGLACWALNVLGKQFDKLLNVTLCYPENTQSPFYDMLSGKMTRIVVRVSLVPIEEDLHGDYVNDKAFKRRFQQWLNALWHEKDAQLTNIKR